MQQSMDKYINQFADQFEEALKIGQKAIIKQHNQTIQNVLVCGMGGSGIGGSIAKDILTQQLHIPMDVRNSYFIPKYVNANTLLIFSSYSGNTEETLAALNASLNLGAKIVCIGTNGKLEKIALENNLDIIKIPAGLPPRAALPYSIVQLFFVFQKLGLLEDSFLDQLKVVPEFLNKHDLKIKAEAKELAPEVFGKQIGIYADQRMAGVAKRFLQQINENAKSLGWVNTFPEMNHNELVGWASGHEGLAVVVLRNKDDFNRNQKRIIISLEMLLNQTSNIIQLWSEGTNFIEQCFYLIYLTDWLAYELALLGGVDAMEIDAIDYLKEELSKL